MLVLLSCCDRNDVVKGTKHLQSDSPCPLQFWAGCSSHEEKLTHPLDVLRATRTVRSVSRSLSQLPQILSRDSSAQPSEPILFPKLRIYFADFPVVVREENEREIELGTGLYVSMMFLDESFMWNVPYLHYSITRGCTPWRPDADMSTTRSANKSRHRVFKGRRERTETAKS